MSLAKISPNFPKYSCETCGIFTNNKKDYTNHLMTAKHSKFTSFNTLSQNLPQNGTIFPQNSSITVLNHMKNVHILVIIVVKYTNQE